MSARKLLITGIVFAFFASTGCESMSNTAKGGLIGGGVGTGLGAIAGGGKGALIGGLAGTAIGGIIGNDIDQEEKREKDHRLAVAEAKAAAATAPPPPAAAPLGMMDVVQMSREGMAENVIINQIRATHSTYQLSVEDLRMLQANNVSPRVIEEMQLRRPTTRVIREQPRVIYTSPPPPVYVYEPYPYGYYPRPPRPYTSVGIYTRIP